MGGRTNNSKTTCTLEDIAQGEREEKTTKAEDAAVPEWMDLVESIIIFDRYINDGPGLRASGKNWMKHNLDQVGERLAFCFIAVVDMEMVVELVLVVVVVVVLAILQPRPGFNMIVRVEK